MRDVLAEIVAHKRTEIAAAKARTPLAAVESRARALSPPRDFLAALKVPGTRIIAECKKQSPSRGVLVHDYDPAALARAYEAGGAAAISVLTDERYFGGRLADLAAVKAAVSLPVLRKDFIVDAYQVVETRAAGADTFLLLAGVLTTSQLDELLAVGRGHGMEPLIESHSEAELALALASRGQVFGINNRDLKTFAVDLDTARRLARKAHARTPKPLLVCESGIKTGADIERMAAVGYKAFLIGEALVTHPDPQAGLRELLAKGTLP